MTTAEMKLLLVYPQQAKRPGRRVSRSGAQLHGIAQTTRALLDRCKGESVSVQEFAYEHDTNYRALNAEANRRHLSAAFNESDLVIDVSPAPDTNVAATDFAGPVIHLSPSYSGSFVCNDIFAQARGRLLQSDIVNCIDNTNAQHKYVLPSTHELDANMHYAAFSALPTRVGDAFYRNEKDHALILLSFPESLRNEETINSDMQTLSETLHGVDNLNSITFVCESLDDLPLIEQIADGMKQSLGLQPSIWGLRKGEYHDMYSIMAKSNVVLCGGSSLFADAIIRGIPVFVWRTEQAGTGPIAQTYIEHADDLAVLQSTQRKQLDQLIAAQYLNGTLPNYRLSFDHMLSTVINQSLNVDAIDLQPSPASEPQWVIAPARLSEQRNMPDRLSRSSWNDRQKVLGFKQPANREIVRRNDSGDRQVFTRL